MRRFNKINWRGQKLRKGMKEKKISNQFFDQLCSRFSLQKCSQSHSVLLELSLDRVQVHRLPVDVRFGAVHLWHPQFSGRVGGLWTHEKEHSMWRVKKVQFCLCWNNKFPQRCSRCFVVIQIKGEWLTNKIQFPSAGKASKQNIYLPSCKNQCFWLSKPDIYCVSTYCPLQSIQWPH